VYPEILHRTFGISPLSILVGIVNSEETVGVGVVDVCVLLTVVSLMSVGACVFSEQFTTLAITAVGAAVLVRVAVGLAPANGLPEVSLLTNGTAGGLTTESGCPPSDPETRFPVAGRQQMTSTEDAEVADPMSGQDDWRCDSRSGRKRSSRCCVSVDCRIQVRVTADAAKPEVRPDCGRSCDN